MICSSQFYLGISSSSPRNAPPEALYSSSSGVVCNYFVRLLVLLLLHFPIDCKKKKKTKASQHGKVVRDAKKTGLRDSFSMALMNLLYKPPPADNAMVP